jgi:hypothetical protein
MRPIESDERLAPSPLPGRTMMLKPTNRIAFAAILFFAAIVGVQSPKALDTSSGSQKRATIEQALSSFLTAFNNLDWPAFRACFSDDATVFHPAAPNVMRNESPEQFDNAWLGVFERIKRTSGRPAPPYMDLKPQDLRVNQLSPEVGLVTFHLIDGNTVSRRTLVLKLFPDGWKIVHIHASNIVSAPSQN